MLRDDGGSCLGIHPHRPARSDRVDDRGRVGASDSRTAVRVVLRSAELVGGVPGIVNIGSSAGPELTDPVVERLELVRNRSAAVAVILPGPTDPFLCPAQPEAFPGPGIEAAVGEPVRKAWGRHNRAAEVRRQNRQSDFVAVVAPARPGGATVVDVLGVYVRIGADDEPVTSAHRVLDIVLVGRVLDAAQVPRALHSAGGHVRPGAGSVRSGNIVAQLPSASCVDMWCCRARLLG